ncbi:50S ribosomal protein L7/L12 [Camellia lanceoleosa]|uniref:50S ribosomal protein L7/L12 n=1 Tax=Camellia lanceoleosa TaxID=1840588 RepID=A0ACC0FYR9_9ERIC|nr:50S ribosomal protein L7/L12 [Camellia lanceoleosa]
MALDPLPFDKIIQLAEHIASLPIEEHVQISLGGSSTAKAVEKKTEKTAIDVKLEKFDAAAKIKVIKEVSTFTNLGLKEAKDLVEEASVLLKQGVTKEEANDIIEKVEVARGVAIME